MRTWDVRDFAFENNKPWMRAWDQWHPPNFGFEHAFKELLTEGAHQLNSERKDEK